MSTKCWHCGEEIWFKKIGPSSWVALDPPAEEMSELAFGAVPFDRRYDTVHDTTCRVQSSGTSLILRSAPDEGPTSVVANEGTE